MGSKTKQKVKGRLLTLISKVNELKDIGNEDSEVSSILPSMENIEQELIRAYTEAEGL